MKLDCSVIITNYNKPHEQILECINSIWDQTVHPREVIFVDDCSDDPRALAGTMSIILPRNSGVSFARDVGVQMSQGRLLLFVDSDDKLSPDFLEQCSRTTLNYDIAYPNKVLFGDLEQNVLAESPDVITPDDLLGKSLKIVVTSMMHRRVYETLGGFSDLPVYEDWDFWIRAMCNGYTFGKANTLLLYRQNTKSRNHISQEVRSNTHKMITAPYEKIGGTICRKQDV